jgi:heme oxygenase
MIPLKEAIAERHSLAEKMPFNQKMFNGELSPTEYAHYLKTQWEIFSALESHFSLPHPGFERSMAIQADLDELGLETKPIQAAETYVTFLKRLSQEDANAHIYLNYLALLFGGQMMKTKVPGSGKMYAFDQVPELVASVRRIQKDSWAGQANLGLDFIIEILKELDQIALAERSK